MKKQILVIALVLVVALLIPVTTIADGAFQTDAEVSAIPDISAQAYILTDAKTGETIFSKNENQRMPIASTTKVMTCLVVLENTELSDTVTVTAESCGIEGSSVYLYEGESLTVEELLYALMLESANDAAACLALHVADSIDAFSDLMNDKAEELGLKNTHFNNPHGLEDPEHYSTAYDMARVWCEAMKNEAFRKIVGTKTYRIDMEGKDGYRFLSNHNRLLKTDGDCIGGKTGYTKTAGRCLITSSERDGAELVMVTLNAPNDWQDHEALTEYAFSLYSKVELATPGSVEYTLSLVGGVNDSVILKNTDPLTVSLRNVKELKVRVEAPRFVYAPINDTSVSLAKAVYTVGDNVVATLPLYPEAPEQTAPKITFWQKILKVFK